jgi:hypothetical protein
MESRPMLRAALAGAAYFAVVFAAGFVLGTLRVLVLGPRLGESGAVLLELPIILGIAWLACRRLVRRCDVPPAPSARATMGAIALATLLIAELGFSVLAFGRTLAEHLQHYRELPALLGLAGQLAYAAFPMLQGAGRSR